MSGQNHKRIKSSGSMADATTPLACARCGPAALQATIAMPGAAGALVVRLLENSAHRHTGPVEPPIARVAANGKTSCAEKNKNASGWTFWVWGGIKTKIKCSVDIHRPTFNPASKATLIQTKQLRKSHHLTHKENQLIPSANDHT